MKLKSEFKITKWEENTYFELSPDQKMTKATVAFGFTGDLVGTAATEWLMYYTYTGGADPDKSQANYVGYIRVEGTIQGKSGSFVLEDRGLFEKGLARSKVIIVENSGTEGFKGIKGNGYYEADHTKSIFELDYRGC